MDSRSIRDYRDAAMATLGDTRSRSSKTATKSISEYSGTTEDHRRLLTDRRRPRPTPSQHGPGGTGRYYRRFCGIARGHTAVRLGEEASRSPQPITAPHEQRILVREIALARGEGALRRFFDGTQAQIVSTSAEIATSNVCHIDRAIARRGGRTMKST